MNLTTIARPYAKALLALSTDTAAQDRWLKLLEELTFIVQNPEAQKILDNQAIDPQQKADFLCSIFDQQLDAQQKNLITVLAVAKRLPIIPALYARYEQLITQRDRSKKMQLISADAINPQDLEAIKQLLAKRSQEKIILQHALDPRLIAGAKLKVGDRVIDASLQDQLKSFYQHLSQ